jgi:outer membrane immunogenic protein
VEPVPFFGIKGQFDAGNLSGATTVIPAFLTFYSQDTFNNIATLTGRLGFAATPGLLLYVDGGGVWVRDSLAVYGTVPANFLFETATTTLSGYDIGGGLEYKLAPSWSVFAEYDYLGFGTRNIGYVAAPGTVGASNTLATKVYAQTVTVGVNWRFNWLAH